MLYVLYYYCPFLDPPCYFSFGWQTSSIITQEAFFVKLLIAKALGDSPGLAGGFLSYTKMSCCTFGAAAFLFGQPTLTSRMSQRE